MRKWIEVLRKFENLGIKNAPVNSILITKSVDLQLFTLILYSFRVRCDHMRFSVLSPFMEMSMAIAVLKGTCFFPTVQLQVHNVYSVDRREKLEIVKL